MVQIYERRPSALTEFVNEAGAYSKERNEYNRGKSRLQGAFNKLDPNQNFVEQLQSIGPELLSTPGGSQAFSELAPVLRQYSQNQGTKDAIARKRGGQSYQEPTQQSGQQSPTVINNITPPSQPRSVEDQYRYPTPPVSNESTYPERTNSPQFQHEMSQPEIEDMALDIMETSPTTSYNDALNTAIKRNEQIVEGNQRIRGEQQRQETAQQALNKGMMERAENEGLIKTPEDKTVLEKIAKNVRRGADETEKWEYVRDGMRDYDSAKASITRGYDLPNPIQYAYRKLTGSYKSKEDAIKDMQPSLDSGYRKYGLFDEARNDIANSIGLGADDVERAIFPLSKEEKSGIEKFESNPNKQTKRSFDPGMNTAAQNGIEYDFPGESFKLSVEEFPKFKEQVRQYLQDNKKANMIALRGELNQGKKYAWQDIYRAVDELAAERRFVPDRLQDQQMRIIRNAPLPGLAQQFKYFLTGTK